MRSPLRSSTSRRRSLSIGVLVVAFATFVSVANAVADPLVPDPGAPTESTPTSVEVEVPAPAPEPATTPAPAPAPAPEPAPEPAPAAATPVTPAAPANTDAPKPAKPAASPAPAAKVAAAPGMLNAGPPQSMAKVTVCHLERGGYPNWYFNRHEVDVFDIFFGAGHKEDPYDIHAPYTGQVLNDRDNTYPVRVWAGRNVGVYTVPDLYVNGVRQSVTFDGAATLANGCTGVVYVAPPADVCPNIAGNQATVPAGMVLVGGRCVPAAVTCEADQTPTDNGGAPGTVAGDGIADVCVNNPDTTCAFDEVPVNRSGGPTRESCRAVPETCTGLGELGALPIDTNGNGNPDTCVRVTPIIDCGVANADGTRTLHWRYRNSTGQVLQISGLRNIMTPSSARPTTFATGEASFTTTISSGTIAQTWIITGTTAIGFASSAITPRCYPDACPNIAGDQQSTAGYAVATNGACVTLPPTCAAGEIGSDTDNDGVNDICVPVPVLTCPAGFELNGENICVPIVVPPVDPIDPVTPVDPGTPAVPVTPVTPVVPIDTVPDSANANANPVELITAASDDISVPGGVNLDTGGDMNPVEVIEAAAATTPTAAASGSGSNLPFTGAGLGLVLLLGLGSLGAGMLMRREWMTADDLQDTSEATD